jgi:hypothetical protein
MVGDKKLQQGSPKKNSNIGVEESDGSKELVVEVGRGL